MHITRLLVIAFFLWSAALAQKGTAPKNAYRYPSNYHGDTFTGEVLRSDDNHLILEYNGTMGSQIFMGRTEGPCMAHLKADPKQTKELHLSTIPNKTVVTAYYNPGKKSTGTKENLILAIRFDRWNGRDFTNPRRPLIPCSIASKQINTN